MLELALKSITEKPRYNRVLRRVLYLPVKNIKHDFPISRIADFVATADPIHFNYVMDFINQNPKITLKLITIMTNSKYITNTHKKVILNILKKPND